MPLSLSQVLKPVTETNAVNFIVETLTELGLAASSWQEGSIQLNVIRAVARTYADGTSVVTDIAQNVIVKPTGLWLDIVGVYRFGIERLPAIATERNVLAALAASASPIVIVDGSYFATVAGVRYRTAGGPYPIGSGGSDTVAVVAEIAGVAGNVPAATALKVQTPAYPGLAVSFIDEDLTTIGVDLESDDRYWLRCGLRWAELTYSVGLRAYELFALTAAPSVRRVKALNNYPVDGLIRIVLDPGEPSEIAAVEAYVASRTPPNDDVAVSAASVVSQQITYAPRVAQGFSVLESNAAIQAMLDAMPIGGVLVSGAVAGRLLREKITEVLLCNSRFGVQSVNLTVPAADVVLGATDIVTGVFTVTPETTY